MSVSPHVCKPKSLTETMTVMAAGEGTVGYEANKAGDSVGQGAGRGRATGKAGGDSVGHGAGEAPAMAASAGATGSGAPTS